MKDYVERARLVDGESVFTLVLLGVAIYMFYGTYDFSARAATFPRAIAGAAIVGCGLLLLSSYLPRPIRLLVEEETRIVDQSEESEEMDLGQEADDQSQSQTQPMNSVYTAGLVAGYILVAYLLGFYIATPLFIVGYVFLLDINRLYGGILLIVTLGIVYGFEEALGVPLNEGLLLFVGP